MEKRLRAGCFYQEKEDETSRAQWSIWRHQARNNFLLRSTPCHPTGATISNRQRTRKRTVVTIRLHFDEDPYISRFCDVYSVVEVRSASFLRTLQMIRSHLL